MKLLFRVYSAEQGWRQRAVPNSKEILEESSLALRREIQMSNEESADEF